MADYYPILLRAMDTPQASDAAWRCNLYDRARRTLTSEMQARQPAPSQAQIVRELAALDAAVERIEAERTRSETIDDGSMALPPHPDQPPLFERPRSRQTVWIAGALVVAALSAAAYVLWSSHRVTNLASPATAIRGNANPVFAAKDGDKDGDIPPGIDGGPMDADQSYVFRRQPTFYRTLQPVGTLIVDKSQHFLYLVQPHNVALRYGVGIGRQCADLVGLRHIANMAEWPPWRAPPDLVKQKLAQSGTLAGAPGNPLGALAGA